MSAVSATDDKFASGTILYEKFTAESRVAVSETHQTEKLLHNRPFHFFGHFFFGVVVAVDVASDFGLFQKLNVICSRQHSNVVDLRVPGAKNWTARARR